MTASSLYAPPPVHRGRSVWVLVAVVGVVAAAVGALVLVRSRDDGTHAVSSSTPSASAAPTSVPFHTIADETGLLSIEVPTAWSDVDGRSADDGPSLLASPDLEAWHAGWTAPGVRFFATDLFGPADHGDILDAWVPEGCTLEQRRHPYSVGGFEGSTESYVACGGTGASVTSVVLSPTTSKELVFLQVTTIGTADQQVLDRALTTFRVGDLGR